MPQKADSAQALLDDFDSLVRRLWKLLGKSNPYQLKRGRLPENLTIRRFPRALKVSLDLPSVESNLLTKQVIDNLLGASYPPIFDLISKPRRRPKRGRASRPTNRRARRKPVKGKKKKGGRKGC